MRYSLLVGIPVFAVASLAGAQTTQYSAVPRTYSTRDVIAVLGKPQAPPPGQQLLFDGEVSAGISTSVNCGALSVNFNLKALAEKVAQIPKQLISQADSLLAALPMLTTCYASPSLCAELKNINFQIDEKLKGLTNICKSMNDYINAQSTSESVQEAAAARGKAFCIQQKIEAGQDAASAVDDCQNAPKMLNVDIARAWLQDITTQEPQRVLASLLQASGQMTDALNDQQYAFLSAVVGEVKLDANGKLLPVFPARPMTADALAKSLKNVGTSLACDQTRFTAAVREPGLTSNNAQLSVRYYEQALFDTAKEEIDTRDVENLFSLDPPDVTLACNALGRALGKTAMKRVADQSEAVLTTAMQNPANPTPVRQMYEARSDATFRSLRAQVGGTLERSIPELRMIIARMAETVVRTRAEAAGALTKGAVEMDQLRHIPCESDETCGQ